MVHLTTLRITDVDCEEEEENDGDHGRHSLKDQEGPMEPFIRTLTVRFMNQEDSHSVKRLGTLIYEIFKRSPVRQTRPTKV